MPGFRPVLKTFYWRGKRAIRLPYALYHVARPGCCQHIYNFLAFPRVVTYAQYADKLV